MRKYTPLTLVAMILSVISAYSQTISITTTNTPSICYNDGTLTIHATGGTAPYTDSILSGPTNPNLSYPIALPSGQNVFTDLPHGSFTVVVHDAAGHSGTFTESVGGTYQFPSCSLYQKTYSNNWYGTVNSDTIVCQADSSTGRLPFRYAISSTSANSGFGLYQSRNFFTDLCPGTYWIRMIDSCGNIFTNTITSTYQINGAVLCLNFAAGDITLTASGGHPPYTYSIVDDFNGSVFASNQTGVFTGLNFGTTIGEYVWEITDSCGQMLSPQFQIAPPAPTYTADCPFQGAVIANFNNYYPTPPVVISCLNCLPVQSDTFPYGVSSQQYVFGGLQSGNTYRFRMSDACGTVILDTFTVAPSIIVSENFSSCRGYKCTYAYTNGGSVPQSDIDSVIMIYNGIRFFSLTGEFNDLPNTINGFVDTVKVYTNIGCNTVATFYGGVPNFPLLGVPAHSPNCDKVWDIALSNGAFDNEHFYIISAANDTMYGQYAGGRVYTYDFLVPGASYTVVSDSGCSAQIVMDTLGFVSNVVNSYVTCQGQPVITVTGYDTVSGFSCRLQQGSNITTEYIAKLYHNGVLTNGPDTIYYNHPPYVTGNVLTYYPTDTGFYQYRIYRMGLPAGYDSLGHLNEININTFYDTICPQDSGTIYVTRRTVPFPYVNTAYKCNGLLATPPILTIYGGSIPYTVQIPGVDTIIMNTNSIVFPDTAIGTYNVIAYDNCGISRSFTFDIRDTCVCSIPTSIISTTQTSGVSYQFRDSVTGGGSGPFTYSWDFGDGSTQAHTSTSGHTYASGTDTSYTVTLIVTDPCGSDTLTEQVNVVNGITYIALAQRVSVYPNPNQGSFTISLDDQSGRAFTTEISDMLGRSLYRQSIHAGENRLALDLASGVYMVRVTDGVNATVKTMTIK
jgi:hypothetical protein